MRSIALPQNAATDGKDALFPAGEGAAGEKDGGDGGVFCTERAEVIGEDADFFEFFGGGADGVGGLGEAEEVGHVAFMSRMNVADKSSHEERSLDSLKGARFGMTP